MSFHTLVSQNQQKNSKKQQHQKNKQTNKKKLQLKQTQLVMILRISLISELGSLQRRGEESSHINPVAQPIFPVKKAAEENRSLSKCIISSEPVLFSHRTITHVILFLFSKAVAY